MRIVSDHHPIVLDSNPIKWGPGPFCFDKLWLEHSSFKKELAIWWKNARVKGWPGYAFIERLRIVKEKVKEWSKKEYGSKNNNIRNN